MSQDEFRNLTQPYSGSNPEDNVWETTAEQTKETGGLGAKPLYVLTRGEWSDARPGWMSAETQTQLRVAWEDFQADLAGLSTNSRHETVQGAGHGLHQARPQAAIDAIREVVNAARSGSELR